MGSHIPWPGMVRRPLLRWALGGVLTVAGVGALAGCADQDVVVVEIRDHRFSPAAVTVTPGTTVRWINHDVRPHSIRLADSADDVGWEGAELTSGEQLSHTFEEAARLPYHCAFHAEEEMVGVLVVDAADGGG